MFFSKKSTESNEAGSVVATLEREDEAPAEAAIAEAPAPGAPPAKAKHKDDNELEYEWELETPFGKLELELEPRSRKEDKERRKREKQERDAAKQAGKLAKKAERAARSAAKKGAASGEVVVVRRGNLAPVLVVFAIIVTAIAIAYWLFARPGAEEEDQIPPELRTDESLAAAAREPEGIAGRLRRAIRAGRQASREAQAEQQRRFEEATKQS
jgi:hypothetical protein